MDMPSSHLPAPSRGPVVELCAGLGGLGLGLSSLGFEVVRAYDSWSGAVAVYNRNQPRPVAKVCDLLTPIGLKIVARDVKKSGDIELLAAGPPCKGFSQLKNGRHDGRRKTNKIHNQVLAAIPEYVAKLRPRMVLIENVPALASHRAGRTLADFLKRLAAPERHLRYVVQCAVYDSAHFGVPQSRRRLFILAVRNSESSLQLPSPKMDLRELFAAVRHGKTVPHRFEEYARRLADPDDVALTTASQALSDLPPLPAGEVEAARPYACDPLTAYQRWVRRGNGDTVNGTQTPRVQQATIDRLTHISPGGCARSLPAECLNGLERRYDSAYRRLHPDAPSTALSTKYDCVYHYSRDRALSLREYARLQSLPDTFSFPEELVCRRSAYEMIGNSVPPLLVAGVLAEALTQTEESGARRIAV